ncbi:TonB family protein [Maribacter sp. 2308TA10-17]|uniref:TonB family protein n=1 Tax=Maribacter sp. 2308TA10-17 TaxID=3386276 RepID=UPI0039BD28CE
MIQYILECIAFQLVFLIIYDLFLKRETFFQWNRLYLIGTYIISMVLPWIKIEAMKTTVPQSFQAYPEFLWNTNDIAITATTVQETSFTISWEYALLYGGMLLATVFFGYKLYQIYSLKRKGEVHYFKDFTQIVISNSSIAFSFFKSIFLGDKVIAKEHQSIVQHELVHIRQRHSYDLIFFELMRIVGWFNPLVYVYQSRVSELHEFIADAQVAKTNKKEQYEFLLSQVFQTQNISFINQFFKTSLIKKRIVMLQRNQSKKIWKLKYLLLLPLVFGMLAYTSAEPEDGFLEKIEQLENNGDKELILEVQKQIEKEMKSFINSRGEILENKEFDVQTKAIYNLYQDAWENNNSEHILSKKAYFKKVIISNMLFRNMEDLISTPNNPLGDYRDIITLPSTGGYENYVNRKKAFKILDQNLKYSIAAFNQDIMLFDKSGKFSNQSLVFEVIDVKDLTGKELKNLNDKLSEVFEKENSKYADIVLADSNYVFKISSTTKNSELQMHLRNMSFPIGKTESDTIDIREVKNRNKTIVRDTDPIPFAKVDQVPVFPGCENFDDKRACFQEMMQRHISKNFNYPKEAQEKGIQGRVNTIFIISKKGEIEGLRMRGPDSLLEKEVARIIGKLPKMKPGKHKGKKVDVPFSIPVTFKLKGKDNFEILPIDPNRFGPKVAAALKQYNQLVTERSRLLKSSNEKNPIIVNLDEQLRRLKESLSSSLEVSVNNLNNSLGSLKESINKSKSYSAVIDKRGAEEQYLLLLKERERLLLNSNEKNPIVVNLDMQLESLRKSIYQDSETVPFATVDKVPVFPGCEDVENKRKCFNEKMQKHISKNFNYPKEAQEKGIQGRVAVMFTIASNGSVQNIRKRGPDELLENEVERIIKRLPNMKPGEHKGKAVNVPFSIPITFKLKKDNDSLPLNLILDGPSGKSPLVIIDGKESFNVKLHELEPDEIESINVFKDDAATRKYGEKGKNGVIEVKTKKFVFSKPNLDTIKLDTNNGTDPIYFIDGKESSGEKAKAINPNYIESINVLKGESAEAVYGKKGKNGVIQITTKKKE